MKLVIFDLDDTLIESSALREYRDDGDWDEVRARMGALKPFLGVASMLEQVKAKGCKIAIVTSSPRWYAENLVAKYAFPHDALIAYGDYKYSKPSKDPIVAAMKVVNITTPANVLAVGDRCIDTAAAHDAKIFAVGALWGAANPRDLRLSLPEYIADTPEKAEEVIGAWLASSNPAVGPIKPKGWLAKITKEYLWKVNPSGDYRPHLKGAYDYASIRHRYRGNWGTSWANSLISSFKSHATTSAARHFKEIAAGRFCLELKVFLPKNAYVTYVLPSTKKGEEDYDDRWELLAGCLEKSGIKSLWPISIRESRPPAHEAEADSELRDPETIMSNLVWDTDLPDDCTALYIIDDVLTKGGHLRAYADFIQERHPDISITCVAWGLHTSTPWYLADPEDDWPVDQS